MTAVADERWETLCARCMVCGHKWVAVVPAGVSHASLECGCCGAQDSRAYRDRGTTDAAWACP